MKGFIEFEASNLKTAISVGAIKMIVEHKDSVEIVTDGYSYFTERGTYSEICAKIEEAQREDKQRVIPYTGTCGECRYWNKSTKWCNERGGTRRKDDGCTDGDWRDNE